jgi:hypothetical protein
VVDDFHGDAAGAGFREGAAVVAVEGGPGVFVDLRLEGGFEGFVGVVLAEEVGVADEEALLVGVGEEVGRFAAGVLGIALGLAEQVVDEGLGVDLFLDVERRRGDVERDIALAASDELGIEIGIALLVGDLDGLLQRFIDDRLHFRRGDVLAGGVGVGLGGDDLGRGGLGGFLFGGHLEVKAEILKS